MSASLETAGHGSGVLATAVASKNYHHAHAPARLLIFRAAATSSLQLVLVNTGYLSRAGVADVFSAVLDDDAGTIDPLLAAMRDANGDGVSERILWNPTQDNLATVVVRATTVEEDEPLAIFPLDKRSIDDDQLRNFMAASVRLRQAEARANALARSAAVKDEDGDSVSRVAIATRLHRDHAVCGAKSGDEIFGGGAVTAWGAMREKVVGLRGNVLRLRRESGALLRATRPDAERVRMLERRLAYVEGRLPLLHSLALCDNDDDIDTRPEPGKKQQQLLLTHPMTHSIAVEPYVAPAVDAVLERLGKHADTPLSGPFAQLLRFQPKSSVCPKQQSISRELQRIDSWELFDGFALDDATDGNGLFFLAQHVLSGFAHELSIDSTVLRRFLLRVQGLYRPPTHNAFHNAQRQIFVLQAAFWLLKSLPLSLSPLQTFAMLIAALCCDMDHPGFNNSFHVRERDAMFERGQPACSAVGARYVVPTGPTASSSRSITEQHSCAVLFELLTTDPSCNILKGMSEAHRTAFRSVVLECVIAGTDMARHSQMLQDWREATEDSAAFLSKAADSNPNTAERDATRTMIGCAVMKLAIMSDYFRPARIHLALRTRGFAEFFNQGDAEKHRGWSVSPFMDREAPVRSRAEISFINYVAAPTVEYFIRALGSSTEPLLLQCHANKDMHHQATEGDANALFGPL